MQQIAFVIAGLLLAAVLLWLLLVHLQEKAVSNPEMEALKTMPKDQILKAWHQQRETEESLFYSDYAQYIQDHIDEYIKAN